MNNKKDTIGYLQLLRQNPNYRNLWYSQAISNLGDWFNHVAIMVLLVELTGSGLVMGISMIMRFLPYFFFSPVAGVVADRFNRRTIMVMTDIFRGLVVLCFLAVDGVEDVWLVYTLVAAQLSFSAFFEPARNAVVPTVVTKKELLVANVFSGATWSLMLSIGGICGGLVVHLLGMKWAFLIDSATYFLSASFLLRVAVPPIQRVAKKAKEITWKTMTGLEDMIAGAQYLITHKNVLWLISIKTINALSAGAALLLVVMGDRVFPINGSAAASIGILHGAWGIGAVLGPVFARRWTKEDPSSMRRSIGRAMLVRAVFLTLLGFATNLWVACVMALMYMAAGSVLWVFSGTLLQMAVPDSFRGRVFASEWAAFTLMMCFSHFFVGWGIDVPQWSPGVLAAIMGLVMVPFGLTWLWQARHRDHIFETEQTAGMSDETSQ